MKFEPFFLTASLLNLGSAAAFEEPKICYILDGILFFYGIILTVLYCRLKMKPGSTHPPKKPEGQYEGLTKKPEDVYEIIPMTNQKGVE